ncbi:hypothetical protein T12_15128 [Trichinella patagoniensis]|uniref:PiggyBac transposable element-derived protein domain-containing protein n=1 Tax=Trichinella patagoniensis TaxID=990121 RepID=A0A0V1A959_9BILA|nr:hypothetical protein T12_15128 [Trichinella patagoniensis]
MGGVDLNNMPSAVCKTDRNRLNHCYRSGKRVVAYRRGREQFPGHKRDAMDLHSMMTKVIESLCLTRKASSTFQEVDEPCSSRGAIAMPRIVHDVQKDLVTHWPYMRATCQRYCFYSKLSFVYCRKCNASLCMNKARN